MIQCPKCSAENPPDNKFCGSCGEELSSLSQAPTVAAPEGEAAPSPAQSPHVGRHYLIRLSSSGRFYPRNHPCRPSSDPWMHCFEIRTFFAPDRGMAVRKQLENLMDARAMEVSMRIVRIFISLVFRGSALSFAEEPVEPMAGFGVHTVATLGPAVYGGEKIRAILTYGEAGIPSIFIEAIKVEEGYN